MSEELWLERVRKLLAKAEGTANPHEAEAFSAKAATLIARYRISPERLRAAAGETLAVRRRPMGKGAYVRARLALLMAVADAHDVEVVFRTGPTGMTALLAGFTGDLDAVDVLYESLHIQAAAQMAAQRRATPAATQRWRRGFLLGYANRLREILGEARSHAHSSPDPERSAADVGAVVPDLVARAEQVRQFAAASFGRVVAASRPAPAVAHGFAAGRQAAARVDIGRSRLPGRQALGRGGDR